MAFSRILILCSFFISTKINVWATSMVPLDLSELISKSNAIVHAKLISDNVIKWKGQTWTELNFQIIEYLKGDGPSKLNVVQPGGVFGKFKTSVTGIRKFLLNTNYCLFLWQGLDNKWQVIGYSQGSFKLEKAGSEWLLEPDSKNYSLSVPAILQSRLKVSLTNKNDSSNLKQFYARRNLDNLKKLILNYD